MTHFLEKTAKTAACRTLVVY